MGIAANLNNLTKETGFNSKEFAEFLEQQYLKRNKTKRRQKFSFSPSSIGYGKATCARYWHYALSGAEFEDLNDAKSIANMDNGSSVHARLQKLLDDADILVDKEVEIRLSDPPILGYVDAMIRWKDEVMPVEIKSMRPESFVHRQYNQTPPGYHLIQLLIYLRATGKKVGAFIYENKSDQSILVIKVEMNERNEALLNEVLDWLREVYKVWKDKKLPQRPFKKTSTICKNCPVQKTCWADERPVDIEIIPMKELK